MTRFLLTFLALLTGLAATGTPAAARMRLGDGAEIGAVAGLVEAGCQAECAQGVALPVAQITRLLLQAGNPRAAYAAALVPAVLTGIDRARE